MNDINDQKNKASIKDTIRDGGSTALYTAYSVDSVYTVGTAYTVLFKLLRKVLRKEPANKRKYFAIRNLQNLHRLADHRFTPLVQGVGVIDELLHDFNDLFFKIDI